jgi:hypothetical protein
MFVGYILFHFQDQYDIITSVLQGLRDSIINSATWMIDLKITLPFVEKSSNPGGLKWILSSHKPAT